MTKKTVLCIAAIALAVILVVVIIIGTAGGGKKERIEVEPYEVDLSKLLFIGGEGDWRANNDVSKLANATVPWTYTECTNLYKLDPGVDSCGRCPTCEGKTSVVMNPVPLQGQWADYALYFPPFPEDMNWMNYNRTRVRIRYYYDDWEEFDPSNGKVMVSYLYDPDDADWRGPAEAPGPNSPLKSFNLTNGPLPGQEEDEMPYGSRSTAGGISSPKGAFMFLTKAPKVILFQNGDPNVAYVEVTEISFFRWEDEDD